MLWARHMSICRKWTVKNKRNSIFQHMFAYRRLSVSNEIECRKNANIIRLSLDGDWVGVCESWLNFRTDYLRFTTKIDIEIKYLWRRKAKNCFSITSSLYLSPPHRHKHTIRLNLSIRHRSFEWVRDGHIFACVDDWQWEWSMLASFNTTANTFQKVWRLMKCYMTMAWSVRSVTVSSFMICIIQCWLRSKMVFRGSRRRSRRLRQRQRQNLVRRQTVNWQANKHWMRGVAQSNWLAVYRRFYVYISCHTRMPVLSVFDCVLYVRECIWQSVCSSVSSTYEQHNRNELINKLLLLLLLATNVEQHLRWHSLHVASPISLSFSLSSTSTAFRTTYHDYYYYYRIILWFHPLTQHELCCECAWHVSCTQHAICSSYRIWTEPNYPKLCCGVAVNRRTDK